MLGVGQPQNATKVFPKTGRETRVLAPARAVSSNTAHQVHDRVDFVVAVQDVCEELVQMSHVGYWEVFGFTDPVRKVAEEIWFGK